MKNDEENTKNTTKNKIGGGGGVAVIVGCICHMAGRWYVWWVIVGLCWSVVL